MKVVPYLLLILPALLTGCGPGASEKLYPVQGTVTLDGAPLPAGTVTFHPFLGTAAKAQIINGLIGSEGKYEMQTDDAKGVPAGEYAVAVFASIAKDSTSPPEQLAPERYNDPAKSGLKVIVSDKTAAGAYDLKLTN